MTKIAIYKKKCKAAVIVDKSEILRAILVLHKLLNNLHNWPYIQIFDNKKGGKIRNRYNQVPHLTMKVVFIQPFSVELFFFTNITTLGIPSHKCILSNQDPRK